MEKALTKFKQGERNGKIKLLEFNLRKLSRLQVILKVIKDL